MEMKDILSLAQDIVEKLAKDKDLMKAFEKDPVALVEKTLGIDLPNDQINALIDGIKAKLKADDVLEAAGKLFGMFGKK